MTGSAIGVVAVRLTKVLADKLLELSELTYSSTFERETLVKEMVAEFVNIIAGNVANELENYDINISLPFVVQGENHSVSWPADSPIICMPFSTSYGPFEVNVSMIESEKLQAMIREAFTSE